MTRVLKAAWYVLISISALWASGVIQAIIPAAVPAGNKEGNSSKFALFSGADPGTNDCGKFDAAHNLVGAGAACGTVAGAAGSNGSAQFNNSSAFGGFFGFVQPNLSASGAPLASLPQSGWTVNNSAVLQDFASNVTGVHILQNASLNLRTITRAISVPYTLYAVIDCRLPGLTGQVCGVYIHDSTKYYGIELVSTTGADLSVRTQQYTSATSSFGTSAGPTASVVHVQQAFKITNDGMNRTWNYYSNGAWVQLLTESSGAFFLVETSAGVGGADQAAAVIDTLDLNLLYYSVQ